MPTGIFDIRDRAEVFTPDEIRAGQTQCVTENLQYIEIPGAPAIREGYCTISLPSEPPTSDKRH